MPIALETSKRKFHKLLENLSSATPSPRQPGIDPTLPAAKRVHVEHKPGSLRAIAQANRLAAEAAKNASRGSVEPVAEPNYNPWSHPGFLARLKTFADLRLWSPKPDAINEVAWAKRGWTCSDINTVTCKGGCEQHLVVGLRPRRKDEQGHEIDDSEDYSVDVDDALVQRYVELIETGHDEPCLWRTTGGCKDDIYRLPIARPSIWQPQLRDRYRSFEMMAVALPPLSRIEHPFDLNEVADFLPADFAAADSPQGNEGSVGETDMSIAAAVKDRTPISPSPLAFALLGWKGSLEESGCAIASCPACFRRLGLWLYAAKDSAAPSPLPPDRDLDDESEEGMKLDLLGNHRDYCPWINHASQCMSGAFADLAAWEILQKVIQNHAELRHGEEVLKDGPHLSGAEQRQDPTPDIGVPGGRLSISNKGAKEIETEDKVRFARFKELTRSMGMKAWRNKLLKAKAGSA